MKTIWIYITNYCPHVIANKKEYFTNVDQWLTKRNIKFKYVKKDETLAIVREIETKELVNFNDEEIKNEYMKNHEEIINILNTPSIDTL